MKAVVKKSILFAFVSLLTIGISAQGPQKKEKMSTEDRASKQTEMMTKKLMLTPEQEAKIKEINLKYAQQMNKRQEQKQENMKKDRQEFAAEIKSQMEAKDAEFKDVLTPEQYQQWQENRKETKVFKKGKTMERGRLQNKHK